MRSRALAKAVRKLLLFSLAVTLAGCGGSSGSSGGSGSNTGGGGSTGGGSTVPSAATSFYVVQNSLPPQPPQILQFLKTASGSVAPTATITGPASLGITAMTIDASGNLYAGGPVTSGTADAGAEVIVYAAGASGTAKPSQTFTNGLDADSTATVFALAVDSTQNLYAATDVAVGSGASGRIYQGISVWPIAGGNVAPVRSIYGAASQIGSPTQIAVDSAGNLYVANPTLDGPSSILIFNSSATGNVAPTNLLAGSKTTIYNAQGVTLDSAGDIYVASIGQTPLPTNPLGGTPSILKFTAGSTGNVAPVVTISGSATTMGIIGNLRVDSDGNIYMMNGSSILRFAAGASGNVAPAATITSSAFFQTNGPIAVQ